MPNVMFGTLELPSECYWKDEFDWTPVGQVVKHSLTGSLVVEHIFSHKDGRPMTLFCKWADLDLVRELETLRDRTSQDPITVTLPDARTFSTIFRHDEEKPIEVTPLIERTDYSDGASLFDVAIKLRILE